MNRSGRQRRRSLQAAGVTVKLILERRAAYQLSRSSAMAREWEIKAKKSARWIRKNLLGPNGGGGARLRLVGEMSGSGGVRGGLRIVRHPADVNEHDGVIPDHPGVVSGRNERHISGAEFLFAAVVHYRTETPGQVVLQVGNLTTLGLRKGFHTG